MGHNNFSCLISPEMFNRLLWEDSLACCDYVDHSIYHLDGPTALQRVPRLLELESLDCQQIQGAGKPLPSEWTELLRRIQDGGKSVQVMYESVQLAQGADFRREIDALCDALDPSRLLVAADVDSLDLAELIVRNAKQVCRDERVRPR